MKMCGELTKDQRDTEHERRKKEDGKIGLREKQPGGRSVGRSWNRSVRWDRDTGKDEASLWNVQESKIY